MIEILTREKYYLDIESKKKTFLYPIIPELLCENYSEEIKYINNYKSSCFNYFMISDPCGLGDYNLKYKFSIHKGIINRLIFPRNNNEDKESYDAVYLFIKDEVEGGKFFDKFLENIKYDKIKESEKTETYNLKLWDNSYLIEVSLINNMELELLDSSQEVSEETEKTVLKIFNILWMKIH